MDRPAMGSVRTAYEGDPHLEFVNGANQIEPEHKRCKRVVTLWTPGYPRVDLLLPSRLLTATATAATRSPTRSAPHGAAPPSLQWHRSPWAREASSSPRRRGSSLPVAVVIDSAIRRHSCRHPLVSFVGTLTWLVHLVTQTQLIFSLSAVLVVPLGD
jgi:hypothetical protein